MVFFSLSNPALYPTLAPILVHFFIYKNLVLRTTKLGMNDKKDVCGLIQAPGQ
ncbi:hypothetical protein DSUL_50020 [Desulfovibrionales bacterium]